MTSYRIARGGSPLTVVDGRFDETSDREVTVELGDVLLLPGFVDLHADSFSRFEQPRAGVTVPLGHALDQFDTAALLAGVTTPFLCVSLEDFTVESRSADHALRVLEAVDGHRGDLKTDLRVHLRVDLTGPSAVSDGRELVARFTGLIGLVSAMDHTPGQGQYADVDGWRRSMRARDSVTDAALDDRLSRMSAASDGMENRRKTLASTVRAAGIPFASHDDDSTAAVDAAIAAGAAIAEFPMTEAAAARAEAGGLAVAVGSPNLWRGASHGSGPSARELVGSGCADILVSDYDLSTLLPGILVAAGAGVADLARLVRMTTREPAQRVGLIDRGTLEAGARADFIAVAGSRVVGVWVEGRRVLTRS